LLIWLFVFDINIWYFFIEGGILFI